MVRKTDTCLSGRYCPSPLELPSALSESFDASCAVGPPTSGKDCRKLAINSSPGFCEDVLKDVSSRRECTQRRTPVSRARLESAQQRLVEEPLAPKRRSGCSCNGLPVSKHLEIWRLSCLQLLLSADSNVSAFTACFFAWGKPL